MRIPVNGIYDAKPTTSSRKNPKVRARGANGISRQVTPMERWSKRADPASELTEQEKLRQKRAEGADGTARDDRAAQLMEQMHGKTTELI